MSTVSGTLNIDASVADTDGVSIFTSTGSSAHPSWGLAYSNLTQLACGGLVHVHRMLDGDVLLAYRREWVSAVKGSTQYTVGAHTDVTGPRFYQGNPISGAMSAIKDHGGTAPGVINNTFAPLNSLNLIGGASTPTNVYYLTTGYVNGTTQGMIQAYGTSYNHVLWIGDLRVENSTSLTNGGVPETITWNRGIFIENNVLYVIGSRGDGALYMCRANVADLFGPSLWQWQYLGVTGWSAEPSQKDIHNASIAGLPDPSATHGQSQLSPIMATATLPLCSAGPVSYAYNGAYSALSVISAMGTGVSATIYTAPSYLGPWTQAVDPVVMGDSSTGTYLGGTLYLQQSLFANPINSAIANTITTTSGIPYCYSVGGANIITTTWRVLPVPRIGSAAYVVISIAPSGKTIYAGHGVPGTITGSKVGDEYVNVDNGDFYILT